VLNERQLEYLDIARDTVASTLPEIIGISMRLDRAYDIVKCNGVGYSIEQIQSDCYQVRKASTSLLDTTDTVYQLVRSDNTWRCDCPDYDHAPLNMCKHRLAVMIYVRIIDIEEINISKGNTINDEKPLTALLLMDDKEVLTALTLMDDKEKKELSLLARYIRYMKYHGYKVSRSMQALQEEKLEKKQTPKVYISQKLSECIVEWEKKHKLSIHSDDQSGEGL
jgi:hypothetical protein